VGKREFTAEVAENTEKSKRKKDLCALRVLSGEICVFLEPLSGRIR